MICVNTRLNRIFRYPHKFVILGRVRQQNFNFYPYHSPLPEAAFIHSHIPTPWLLYGAKKLYIFRYLYVKKFIWLICELVQKKQLLPAQLRFGLPESISVSMRRPRQAATQTFAIGHSKAQLGSLVQTGNSLRAMAELLLTGYRVLLKIIK